MAFTFFSDRLAFCFGPDLWVTSEEVSVWAFFLLFLLRSMDFLVDSSMEWPLLSFLIVLPFASALICGLLPKKYQFGLFSIISVKIYGLSCR